MLPKCSLSPHRVFSCLPLWLLLFPASITLPAQGENCSSFSWSWKSSAFLCHLPLLGFRVEFLPFKQHESRNSSELCYKYTYLPLKHRGAGLEQGSDDSRCETLLHLYYQRQHQEVMKHGVHQALLMMLRQRLTYKVSQSKPGECR